MPTVETTTLINAPLCVVYEIARDNRSFPEFMDDVKSLEVTSDDGTTVVSDWVGTVPTFGLKIRWTQEDIWDHAAHSCHFRQVTGDYDMLEGIWNFSEEEGGTRFSSRLEYVYNVPMVGPIINKVIHKIVIKNMEDVLAAIKKRSESRS